jgi:hypothetical protein
VFPVRYEHHPRTKKQIYPLKRHWRPIGVSCEMRTSSTYQQQSYPRNSPWRPTGMFPVRYEYNLHRESKTIPVPGRGGPYGCGTSRLLHDLDNQYT